jgi:hypothetical protein
MTTVGGLTFPGGERWAGGEWQRLFSLMRVLGAAGYS